MSLALGIAALVGVSAITPGPNNVAVMTAAAHRGFAGALPAIGGVVVGSLVMVLLASAGIGAVLAAVPAIAAAIAVAGSACLSWLGLRMIYAARGRTEVDRPVADNAVRSIFPGGFAGLFMFQFLNPKGWTMVLTAVASAQTVESSIASTAWVMGTFLIVPAACLSLWALSGALLSGRLAHPVFRRRFDRIMGSTLVISALLLLADAWRAGGADVVREVWR